MNIKRFNFIKRLKPQRFKLHISSDYEHIHIYEYQGYLRQYEYNSTHNIDVFILLSKMFFKR